MPGIRPGCTPSAFNNYFARTLLATKLSCHFDSLTERSLTINVCTAEYQCIALANKCRYNLCFATCPLKYEPDCITVPISNPKRYGGLANV